MHTPKQAIGRTRKAKQARTITFHSENGFSSDAHPAINVKYYGTPSAVYTEGIDWEMVWNQTVEQFWFGATMIAHDHGYSGVFSEGRSSGWLVPFYQYQQGKLVKFTEWPGQGPDKGYPQYPDVNDDPAEAKKFLRFQKAILDFLADVPEMLESNAKEVQS